MTRPMPTSHRFKGLHALALSLATAACSAAPTVEAQVPAAPVASGPLFAEELKDGKDFARALRAHYTKYEYRIAMRDGVRLHCPKRHPTRMMAIAASPMGHEKTRSANAMP